MTREADALVKQRDKLIEERDKLIKEYLDLRVERNRLREALAEVVRLDVGRKYPSVDIALEAARVVLDDIR